MATLDVYLLWAGIALVIAVLGFVSLGIYRAINGVNLLIVRDYRKNRKFDKPVQLKMFIDSKSGAMKMGKLYRSWISIWEADTRVWELPDLQSIKYGGTVFAVRGASGDINDDNLYFVPLPDVGEIGAMDYSEKLSAEVTKSLVKLTDMNPRDFAAKIRDKQALQKLLQETFSDKWVLNKLGIQSVGKVASLPRQYKSFLINRLEKEKGFGAARQDFMSKLLAALPMLMLGIAVFLIGLGVYNVDQGNALMISAQQTYQAQEYTWLATQNYAVASALAKAGIYGYNATLQEPPMPPNVTGVQLPKIPAQG